MARLHDVPVIDIGSLMNDGRCLLDDVINRIGVACGERGFFHIVNHGVDVSLIERVREAQREFFALPRRVKRAVVRSKDNARGYYDRELTKNIRDKKEVFDFGFKPAAELPDDHPANRTLDGYNQWPASMPEFKKTMEAYFDACQKLALTLTGAICLSLRLPCDRLHAYLLDSHTSFIRLNYYPRHDPLGKGPAAAIEPLGEMGVHHHSDAGILTLLLQDEIPGLEICRAGEWFPADPVAGALFANLGDMMQVFTNDRYKAPLHRVLASKDQERYSVPFFYNPSYDTDCYPLEALVDERDPPHYSKINWGEFRKRRSDGDYADYGQEVQIADYRVA